MVFQGAVPSTSMLVPAIQVCGRTFKAKLQDSARESYKIRQEMPK